MCFFFSAREVNWNQRGKASEIHTRLARDGSGPYFPQMFCSAVNSSAYTDLQLVWACKREFEFVYHFKNDLNFCRSFVSKLVVQWKTLSLLLLLLLLLLINLCLWIMFINNHSNSLFNRLRGRALSNDSKDKRIFKLIVDHVARPNPMQICACAWIYRWKKTVENQDWVAAGRGPAFSKTLLHFLDIHCLKLKQLFALGSVNIGEYLPRLFTNIHLALGE